MELVEKILDKLELPPAIGRPIIAFHEASRLDICSAEKSVFVRLFVRTKVCAFCEKRIPSAYLLPVIPVFEATGGVGADCGGQKYALVLMRRVCAYRLPGGWGFNL